MSAAATRAPRNEVPATKKNRFGQMQPRLVSVDPLRLHLLVRKPDMPKATAKAYDTISQLNTQGVSDGTHAMLSIMCRDVQNDRPRNLTLMFNTKADAEEVVALCKRALVVRETKPFKQYEDEYTQEPRPIGTGHFAKVYMAKHVTSGLPCAAKVVDKTKLSRTEAKNLLNEISIMRLLGSHPNIVGLYNVYEDEKTLVLCEELCAGGELFDRIVSQKYTERKAREVCKVLLNTIAYYHERSVVHLDLKPENLLLVDQKNDMNIKISDWGLAMVLADGERLSRQCGTPGYTAPEVLAGERINPKGYGTQADIWSMGVITYILLCGYPPYDMKANATFLDEYKIVTNSAPIFEPEDWNPISREAQDFVLKMLVVDPNKRWSAKALLQHKWMTLAAISEDHLESTARCAAVSALPAPSRSHRLPPPLVPQQIQEIQCYAQVPERCPFRHHHPADAAQLFHGGRGGDAPAVRHRSHEHEHAMSGVSRRANSRCAFKVRTLGPRSQTTAWQADGRPRHGMLTWNSARLLPNPWSDGCEPHSWCVRFATAMASTIDGMILGFCRASSCRSHL